MSQHCRANPCCGDRPCSGTPLPQHTSGLTHHNKKPEATEGGAHGKGRDCGENGGPLLESKDCIGAAYTRSLARGLMRETKISLVARTIRQALRNYGHKAAESTLPECIAADVERSLISHQEGAAALTAKEGSDNG